MLETSFCVNKNGVYKIKVSNTKHVLLYTNKKKNYLLTIPHKKFNL